MMQSRTATGPALLVKCPYCGHSPATTVTVDPGQGLEQPWLAEPAQCPNCTLWFTLAINVHVCAKPLPPGSNRRLPPSTVQGRALRGLLNLDRS
jgi:hypothetical protein